MASTLAISHFGALGGMLLVLAIVGVLALMFYTLATKEKAFIRTGVGGGLEKNGRELESVSLTLLNQTDKKIIDPYNAYSVEDLAELARQTESRRKAINAVQQDTLVETAQIGVLPAPLREGSLGQPQPDAPARGHPYLNATLPSARRHRVSKSYAKSPLQAYFSFF